MTKTFIYDNTEVKKTTKTATKTLPSGKIDTLFEITPVEMFNGSWKKWVRETDLYNVVEQNDEQS